METRRDKSTLLNFLRKSLLSALLLTLPEGHAAPCFVVPGKSWFNDEEDAEWDALNSDSVKVNPILGVFLNAKLGASWDLRRVNVGPTNKVKNLIKNSSNKYITKKMSDHNGTTLYTPVSESFREPQPKKVEIISIERVESFKYTTPAWDKKTKEFKKSIGILTTETREGGYERKIIQERHIPVEGGTPGKEKHVYERYGVHMAQAKKEVTCVKSAK